MDPFQSGESLNSFWQVREGDYCLVVENGRPILGKVCEIPQDRKCVYYSYNNSADNGRKYTRGLTDPSEAVILRMRGSKLHVLAGARASTAFMQ